MKFVGLAMNDLGLKNKNKNKKSHQTFSNKRIKNSPCVKYTAFGFSETTCNDPTPTV